MYETYEGFSKMWCTVTDKTVKFKLVPLRPATRLICSLHVMHLVLCYLSLKIQYISYTGTGQEPLLSQSQHSAVNKKIQAQNKLLYVIITL